VTDGDGSRSAVDRLLVRAQAAIAPRPGPADLDAVWASGGLVVDIRPVGQRSRDGEIDGALVVDRNVLEWRLDPTCPHRLPDVTGVDQVIVLVCDEGYASSLAAAGLRELGLRRATDLDGGFQAWRRRQRRITPASPPAARPASRPSG
jgi:rhodanese-related sulfurtransferase